MPLKVNEIIRACEVIARDENLSLCISESVKAGLITGATACALGMILGPVGVAIGGTAGGVAGMSLCKSYKPLWTIMRDMSENDKKKLYTHMLRVVEGLDITDAMMLMTVATGAGSGRDIILRELVGYFGNAIVQSPQGISQ